MSISKDIFTFLINGKKYGIVSDYVERVIRAVEITSIPHSPPIILGVINIHGDIVPVINIRLRFNLPPKNLSISDQFVILRKENKTFAIVIDDVSEYLVNQTIVDSDNIWNGIEYIQGVVKLNDDILVITKVEKFLQIQEEIELQESLINFEKK